MKINHPSGHSIEQLGFHEHMLSGNFPVCSGKYHFQQVNMVYSWTMVIYTELTLWQFLTICELENSSCQIGIYHKSSNEMGHNLYIINNPDFTAKNGKQLTMKYVEIPLEMQSE